MILPYLDDIELDAPCAPEDLKRYAHKMIGDRGLMVYLIWKLLEKEHPEIDAKGLLAKACHQFGILKANAMGECRTADEWMKKSGARWGLLAFDQKITELNEEKAVKIFGCCPHMDAARRVGATEEEISSLCKDIMLYADWGTISPYEHLELTFPAPTCAEGGNCEMTVKLKKKSCCSK